MYIQQVNQDGVSIALIRSEKPLMTDVQSALDLMMTVRAETGCCLLYNLRAHETEL